MARADLARTGLVSSPITPIPRGTGRERSGHLQVSVTRRSLQPHFGPVSAASLSCSVRAPGPGGAGVKPARSWRNWRSAAAPTHPDPTGEAAGVMNLRRATPMAGAMSRQLLTRSERCQKMTTGRRNADSDRDRGGDGSTAALMLGYCRGEREAFERLYARMAPSVLASLVAWTGDRSRAEVLLDRTFQVLHESRSSYVEGADPEPWIGQIARRELTLDSRRRLAAGRGSLGAALRAALARAPVSRLSARMRRGLSPMSAR